MATGSLPDPNKPPAPKPSSAKAAKSTKPAPAKFTPKGKKK